MHRGNLSSPPARAWTLWSTTYFSIVSAVVVTVLNLEVDLNYGEKMSRLMGEVDNDNEPRLVGSLCWLPDLSWWVCSSVPRGLALGFDSIPIKPHFAKSQGLETSSISCSYVMCDSKNLLPSLQMPGTPLRTYAPENSQMRKHRHLHLKIRFFYKKSAIIKLSMGDNLNQDLHQSD